MRNCNDDDDAKPDDDISCMGTEDGDDNSMLELNSIDAAPYALSVTNNVSQHFIVNHVDLVCVACYV